MLFFDFGFEFALLVVVCGLNCLLWVCRLVCCLGLGWCSGLSPLLVCLDLSDFVVWYLSDFGVLVPA